MSFLFRRFGRKNTARKNEIIGPMIEEVSKSVSTAVVSHPATDIYTRIWGMVQFDNLERYYHLYYNVPYIKGAIDMLSDFVVRNGWEWKDGRDDVREFLKNLDNELELRENLREFIRLGLVYGTAYAEIIYENPPEQLTISEIQSRRLENLSSQGLTSREWQEAVEDIIKKLNKHYQEELKRRKSWGRPIALKTLDSRYICVLGDSKGIVHGFIQLLAVPYIYLRKSQVLYWVYEQKSETFEYFYGTSILRPILRTQAIITQSEEDISLAIHFQAYTPIKARVGDPNNPLPETKYNEIKAALEARKAGGNIIVPGYVEVEWMPTQQTLAARIEWFFKHLLREREQAIGIPRFFFGEVGGVSRGAAELLLQEFDAKISGIQESLRKTLMTQLYLPTLAAEFGDLEPEDIPKMVWRPSITGELRQKVISAIEILRNESVPEEEKEKALAYLKELLGVE